MTRKSETFTYIASPELTDNIVDLFCGGGGSGSGILRAYGRLGLTPSGTFVNHWDKAIEIHESNHPEHRHLKEDLFLLDPAAVFPSSEPIKVLWGSPSCQQFSLSRGNRPINEQGRSHADTIPKWVAHLRPEVVIIENVRQFKDYCRLKQRRCRKTNELLWAREVPGKKKGTMKVKTFPLLEPAHRRKARESENAWGKRMIELGYARHLEPDMRYRGEYFDAWIKRIEALGYVSDWKLLRSADYGDPTIRQRLFVQFVRKDTGKRIVWPDQRFIKPGAKRPEFKTNNNRRLYPWPTARNSVIDWTHKGESIYLPTRKALAPATLRRIAIGLVQFGLKDVLARAWKATLDAFSVPASNFGGDRVRSVDTPASTVQCNHRGEGLAEPYLVSCVHGSEKPEDCRRRVSDGSSPLPTLTTSNGEAVVHPSPFILPKDQGHNGDYVTSVDHPVPAVQTTALDHLVEPCVVQANGKSTAISVDKPLGAVTGIQKQYVLEPHITHLRGGDGNSGVDAPCRALTAAGQHQLLTEAFLLVMDNAGKNGANQRAYSVDEPVKTIPVKGNQTVAEPSMTPIPGSARFNLETLEDAVHKVAPSGVDISRVLGLLTPLMAELKKVGHDDIKPWVYVYYSSGAVGADIDTPVPTVRCKEGTAICYPVLEFDGEFMLLDVLYRMLSVKELQRAQGFPDDFVWPEGITKTDIVKAIGNSVSCGVAEAITLAWYSQNEDISGFFERESAAA